MAAPHLKVTMLSMARMGRGPLKRELVEFEGEVGAHGMWSGRTSTVTYWRVGLVELDGSEAWAASSSEGGSPGRRESSLRTFRNNFEKIPRYA